MVAELRNAPSAPIRVLLLEDSDIDAELLGGHLHKAGMQCVVERTYDRDTFVAALHRGEFDVVLADYSLPDFDGLTALDLVRKTAPPDTPFIFVSGVVGEEFAINALQRGATDYVMKRGLNRLAAALERAIAESRERIERRKAQEALRISELSNQLAVELAGLGKWSLDYGAEHIQLDARCKALLGFAPSAWVSLEAFNECCHPEDRSRIACALQGAFASSGQRVVLDYRVHRRDDGEERWLSNSAQCYVDKEKGLHLIGVVADITERKRAEAALQEMNQTLTLRVAERTAERDHLWRLSRDLFAVINPQGVLIEVNPAWTAQLGYEFEALVGTRYAQYVHADDAAVSLLPISNGDGAAKAVENRLRHKDGGYRWISWSAAPGQTGVYAVGRDVTEDKEAAARLTEAQDALRQAQKMEAVGQLTGGVAHDFNNLLQVVVGNLETLQRKLPPEAERMRRAADYAMEGARRAANLTQRLLAFSRRQPLNPRTLELNRLVTGMSELLQRTLGESIQIETRLDQQLWRVAVDENQLESALLNLAVNARDAMPNGGRLTIETRNIGAHEDECDEDLPPGDYACIAVTDSGSGMEAEVAARAFEPFFTTKAVGQGTGLGLSQVYGFVKQSGGHVKIVSTLGVGTSVRIYLPRLLNGQESIPEEEQSQAPAAAPRETVLVVEDDDGVRAYTVELVRELGYRVLEARDGRSALKVLQQSEPIQLLFTDVVLPGGMNGQQLAQRALELRPDLKVLFATGYARDVIVHDGRLDPGVQLIAKPFGYHDVAAKLRNVIGASG